MQVVTMLATNDMKSDDATRRNRGAQVLLDSARSLTAGAERTKLLAAIPEDAFIALGPTVQDRLIGELFRPLNAEAKSAFIESLTAKKADRMAAACAKAMEHDIEAAGRGHLNLPGLENLTNRRYEGQPLPLPSETENENTSISLREGS
jgi:hypothetical protein